MIIFSFITTVIFCGAIAWVLNYYHDKGNHMENNLIYRQAVVLFGVEKQKIKACEELAELIHAICKNNFEVEYSNRVCEEIADVEIMLAQLSLIYSRARIEDFKIQKLTRLKQLIETGERK